MHDVWMTVRNLVGLDIDPGDLNAIQMSLRTIVIYTWTLFLVRLGSRRFLSKASAFDIIVAIMLGSIMSRAINGSGSVGPTMASGLVLLGVHWLFAWVAKRTDWFGNLVKGRAAILIQNGRLQENAMLRYQVSRRDLEEAMRIQGNPPDFETVKEARLERDGSISVLPYRPAPQVVEVDVREGVQTVRIELRTK